MLAVLAAYQNKLVSLENDDVTSGSMAPPLKRPENTARDEKELN